MQKEVKCWVGKSGSDEKLVRDNPLRPDLKIWTQLVTDIIRLSSEYHEM